MTPIDIQESIMLYMSAPLSINVNATYAGPLTRMPVSVQRVTKQRITQVPGGLEEIVMIMPPSRRRARTIATEMRGVPLDDKIYPEGVDMDDFIQALADVGKKGQEQYKMPFLKSLLARIIRRHGSYFAYTRSSAVTRRQIAHILYEYYTGSTL